MIMHSNELRLNRKSPVICHMVLCNYRCTVGFLLQTDYKVESKCITLTDTLYRRVRKVAKSDN